MERTVVQYIAWPIAMQLVRSMATSLRCKMALIIQYAERQVHSVFALGAYSSLPCEEFDASAAQ